MKNSRAEISMKFVALLLGVTGLVLSAVAGAQMAPEKPGSRRSYEIDVAATKEWVETNIDVRGGARLRFTAMGKITYPADES